ncbi:hypothetical protein KIW84_035742 [Lathyrus oleraceus]|uniref:Uncharacterized protein n=1 Tax=Pisum sativum TaxID=3888 RepID=A0A9D4Y4K3_PEA|nr:hypothetical protein KIW84_035742 [Pisum sativum]
MSIDVAAGGALMNKPYPEACDLIEDMAQKHYQWGTERASVEKKETQGGIHEISSMDMMQAKMDALALKVEHISTNSNTAAVVHTECEICGSKGHESAECNLLNNLNTDQVNYAQGNPFSNTYNPGRKNHPNFSYKNQNPIQNYAPQIPQGFQAQKPNQPMQVVPQKSNLEKIMENFISAPQTTPGGQFHGQPQLNPRGQANAIALQSGTAYEGPHKPAMSESKSSKENIPTSQEEEPLEPKKQTDQEGEAKDKTYKPPPPHKPPIPYPQRLKQPKINNQYQKFIKVIEKLHVEIPFTEAITQISSYAKFLKDILTNKRRLDDPKPLECNCISENKLAKKEKDPGSVSIPCILGSHVIDKAFLDLGASVSLMPLDVWKRLNLGELQPTKMSLQLADRPVKYPVGILEDIPVRIDQLYIPTDFVVMDIKDDDDIPILLGRPFLSTAGAIIDVKRGKLTFEVGDEKIEFILSKFLMAPIIDDACYAIDIIDECIREFDQEEHMIEPFSNPNEKDDELKETKPHTNECLALTLDLSPNSQKPAQELKELPKNLRYEFLDKEMNRPVIVSATLN